MPEMRDGRMDWEKVRDFLRSRSWFTDGGIADNDISALGTDGPDFSNDEEADEFLSMCEEEAEGRGCAGPGVAVAHG